MDIYFAILNFTLSGAIGFIGILTLRQSSTSNEVLFAALPLLFALHQFTEGFVWLGVGGYIEARALELASGIFIYYAQGLLPFIIPLSIYLIEKDSKRKKLLAILSTLGLFLAIYTMYGFYQSPSSVEVVNNTLYYSHPWTENIYDASIYILTTCGSLMLSTSISVQIFGLLNFIGLVIIFLLRPYGFTSLWCFYAAVISTLLYFYFSERRIKFLLDIKEKKNEFSNKLEKELDILNKRRISILKRVKNS